MDVSEELVILQLFGRDAWMMEDAEMVAVVWEIIWTLLLAMFPVDVEIRIDDLHRSFYSLSRSADPPQPNDQPCLIVFFLVL